MLVEKRDRINDIPEDIMARFSEEELAVAINFLTKKCVETRGEYPEKITLFVAPIYAFLADSVLHYPKCLFTLNLVERGVLSKDVVIYPEIQSEGANARWGIEEPGGQIIISAGIVLPCAHFTQEIQYKR
jgi:hypothetical protein